MNWVFLMEAPNDGSNAEAKSAVGWFQPPSIDRIDGYHAFFFLPFCWSFSQPVKLGKVVEE